MLTKCMIFYIIKTELNVPEINLFLTSQSAKNTYFRFRFSYKINQILYLNHYIMQTISSIFY